MADRDLTIRLHLDKSDAIASHKAFVDAAKRMNAEYFASFEGKNANTAAFIQANQEREKAIASASAVENKFLTTTAGLAKDAAKQVAGIGIAMVGISSAASAVDMLTAQFQKAREAIFSATEALEGFRAATLQNEALKDRLGDTTGGMVNVLKMMAKTGQTRAEAIGFESAFLGRAQSAIGEGKHWTQADASKIQAGLGKFQATQGSGAEAWGALGGLMMLSMKDKPGVKPEDVIHEGAALFALQDKGGFKTFDSGVKQFAKAAPWVAQGILTDRQAMAATSIFSLTEPDSAGTRTDQFVRSTSLAMHRNRKTSGLADAHNEGTANYYRSLGAKEGMNPFELAKLVAGDVKQKEAEAKAAGKTFDSAGHYVRHGFGAITDYKALATMVDAINDGTLKSYEDMVNDPKLGEGFTSRVNLKNANDVGLQATRAKAIRETADTMPGVGAPEWDKTPLSIAYARIKARDGNEGMPSFGDLQQRSFWDPRETGPMAMFGLDYKHQMHDEAGRVIMEAADANGVKYNSFSFAGQPDRLLPEEQFRVSRELANKGYNFSEQAQGEQARQIEGKYQAAGMIEPAADIKAAAKDMKAAAADIRAAVQPQRAPAMRGKPNQPPAFPYSGTIY